MRIEIAGESGLILYFSDVITPEAAAQVASIYRHLHQLSDSRISDLIPSYNSILVLYDCLQIDALRCTGWLRREVEKAAQVRAHTEGQSALVEVPVYYGKEVGIDLTEVSEQTGMSTDEIVELHTSVVYNVYAIGFAPGFAYLGLTQDALRVSRKSSPRLKVPKGSVALADNQTAIYPSVSPGGWQIIGRTPMELVDWCASPIAPFAVGGRVKFIPIEREEYLRLGGAFDGV